MTRPIIILLLIFNVLFSYGQKKSKYISNLGSRDSLFFWTYRVNCDVTLIDDRDFFKIVKEENIFTMTFVPYTQPRQVLKIVLDSVQVNFIRKLEVSKPRASSSYDVYIITQYYNGKKKTLKKHRGNTWYMDSLKTFFRTPH